MTRAKKITLTCRIFSIPVAAIKSGSWKGCFSIPRFPWKHKYSQNCKSAWRKIRNKKLNTSHFWGVISGTCVCRWKNQVIISPGTHQIYARQNYYILPLVSVPSHLPDKTIVFTPKLCIRMDILRYIRLFTNTTHIDMEEVARPANSAESES